MLVLVRSTRSLVLLLLIMMTTHLGSTTRKALAFMASPRRTRTAARMMAASSSQSRRQWRPTVDDVVRISWGKPAKKKGTGSRGVPHRLNQDERVAFDFATKKGFVEIDGSGWRKQRRDAPLANTYRSYCDARAQPLVALLKDKEGIDTVFVDLSPLRTPVLSAAEQQEQQEQHEGDDGDGGGDSQRADFAAVAAECTSAMATRLDIAAEPLSVAQDESGVENNGDDDEEEELSSLVVECTAEDWLTLPIYRLPVYGLEWQMPRPDAKKLAKALAEHFGTGEQQQRDSKGGKKATKKKTKKGGGNAAGPKRVQRGGDDYDDYDDDDDDEGMMRDRRCGVKRSKMPQVKPGRSRRSGGYGIG